MPGLTDETTTEDEAPEMQVSDEEGGEDLSDGEEAGPGDPEAEGDTGDLEENQDTLTRALPAAPRHMSCSEDEDFVSALDKMVSDNLQERIRENVKPSQLDISVPMSVRSGKKTYDQLQVSIIRTFHNKIISILQNKNQLDTIYTDCQVIRHCES